MLHLGFFFSFTTSCVERYTLPNLPYPEFSMLHLRKDTSIIASALGMLSAFLLFRKVKSKKSEDRGNNYGLTV